MSESWVKIPLDLLRSDAWRSLGINGRRVIDFLLIEHMNGKGKKNGKLKAPHRQLVRMGIGERRVADAIREVEEVGLLDCERGGLRVATIYALTWLPLHDGSAASNRWRVYARPLAKRAARKNRNLPDKGTAALPDKGTADGRNLPDKGTADAPQNLPDKGTALSRSSTRGGTITSELEVAPGADAGPPWSTPVLVELHGAERDAVLVWAAADAEQRAA